MAKKNMYHVNVSHWYRNCNENGQTHTKWSPLERFHSRDIHLCKFIGTKESLCIKKISTPTGLTFWESQGAFLIAFTLLQAHFVTIAPDT